DGEIAMRLGEEPQQLELGIVRVLEFVDEDEAEARPQSRRRRGMVAQQLERERDLIAEVDDAVLLLHAGVGLERRGELLVHRGLVRLHIGVQRISYGLAHRARMRDVRLRRYVLVARAAEELEECPNVRERISRRPVSLERERDVAGRAAVEVLPHENDLLSGRQDPKLAGTSELESELAEHLVAEAVKRTDDRIVQADRGVDVDS